MYLEAATQEALIHETKNPLPENRGEGLNSRNVFYSSPSPSYPRQVRGC